MTGLAALVLALAGASASVIGPQVIGQLPEPSDRPEDKPLYRDIAHLPRLWLMLGLAGAISGGLTGAAIGWSTNLWPWGYLIPLGVVLGYIDLRTRLLPTRLIAPSYVVLLALIGVAATLDHSTDVLIRAGIGWLTVGGLYLILWLIAPRGVGYGDVRFSGLLGLALGCVGWPAIVVGAWFGFLLGGLSGLALRPFTGLKMNAHGPAMVVGAVIGVAAGAPIMNALHR